MKLNKYISYIKGQYAIVVAFIKSYFNTNKVDAFLPGKPTEVLTQPCTDAEGNNIISTDQVAVKVNVEVGTELPTKSQEQRNKEVRKRRYYNNATSVKPGATDKGSIAKAKNRQKNN